MQLGIVGCVSKKDNYIKQLISVISREIGHLQVIRENAAHKSREDRLRQIVEIVPAGITMLAPDGTFLAVNRNGLRLMGATRVEQIVGKNLAHLVPQVEQDRVLAFLGTVSGWTSASICLHWQGLDGTVPGIELRAVPMFKKPSIALQSLPQCIALQNHQRTKVIMKIRSTRIPQNTNAISGSSRRKTAISKISLGGGVAEGGIAPHGGGKTGGKIAGRRRKRCRFLSFLSMNNEPNN